MPGPGFDFGTPDGYDFFLRMGPLANADQKFFKGKIEGWHDLISHDTYTDYLEVPRPAPVLEEHYRRSDDGGRFVRRGRCLRTAPHL